MARSFTEVAPGRIEIREGGGAIAVFGFPFLAAGVAIVLISFGLIPIQNATQVSWYGRPLLGLMGFVFAAVGGTLVFGRAWTIFDATSRTIVKRMGLVVPMTASTHRLDDYTRVRLEFQRGDSGTAAQYPVSLKARAGSNLRLFSSTRYGEARERATAIASLFRLDVEDASSDHVVTLSAEQANLSLQHRLRMTQAAEPPVARPFTMRSEVTATNGGVSIVIPARAVHPMMYLFFLIPMAVPIFFVAPFFRFFKQTNTPDVVSWIFLGFFTLMFGVLPGLAGVNAFLKTRFGRKIVTVSPSGIRIDERRVWRTRPIASFDVAEVMDVDYSTGDTLMLAAKRTHVDRMEQAGRLEALTPLDPRVERALGTLVSLVNRNALTIKTRHALTTLGEGLPDDELQYLHAVVRRAILNGTLPKLA